MKSFNTFINEAVTDDRKEVAKELKKFAKKYVSGPISVTSGKGKTAYVMLRAKGGGEISNELRKMVIDKAMPKANPSNMDDISYGNVTKQSIAISADGWKKVMGLKESVEHLDEMQPHGMFGTFGGQKKKSTLPSRPTRIAVDKEFAKVTRSGKMDTMAAKKHLEKKFKITDVRIEKDKNGKPHVTYFQESVELDEAPKADMRKTGSEMLRMMPKDLKSKIEKGQLKVVDSAPSWLGGKSEFQILQYQPVSGPSIGGQRDPYIMVIVSNPEHKPMKIFAYYGTHPSRRALMFAKNNKLLESVELGESASRETETAKKIAKKGKKLGDWVGKSYYEYEGNLWILGGYGSEAVNRGPINKAKKTLNKSLLKKLKFNESVELDEAGRAEDSTNHPKNSQSTANILKAIRDEAKRKAAAAAAAKTESVELDEKVMGAAYPGGHPMRKFETPASPTLKKWIESGKQKYILNVQSVLGPTTRFVVVKNPNWFGGDKHDPVLMFTISDPKRGRIKMFAFHGSHVSHQKAMQFAKNNKLVAKEDAKGNPLYAKESIELGEGTPAYRKAMAAYKNSDAKKVFDILKKKGFRAYAQSDTLVRNMLKKNKGNVQKAAAEIEKKYPNHFKESVELDEAQKRTFNKGDRVVGRRGNFKGEEAKVVRYDWRLGELTVAVAGKKVRVNPSDWNKIKESVELGEARKDVFAIVDKKNGKVLSANLTKQNAHKEAPRHKNVTIVLDPDATVGDVLNRFVSKG